MRTIGAGYTNRVQQEGLGVASLCVHDRQGAVCDARGTESRGQAQRGLFTLKRRVSMIQRFHGPVDAVTRSHPEAQRHTDGWGIRMALPTTARPCDTNTAEITPSS